MLKIDTGIPLLRKSWPDEPEKYRNGYAYAESIKYAMDRAQRDRILALDVADSYLEGVHDSLNDKANRYAN